MEAFPRMVLIYRGSIRVYSTLGVIMGKNGLYRVYIGVILGYIVLWGFIMGIMETIWKLQGLYRVYIVVILGFMLSRAKLRGSVRP